MRVYSITQVALILDCPAIVIARACVSGRLLPLYEDRRGRPLFTAEEIAEIDAMLQRREIAWNEPVWESTDYRYMSQNNATKLLKLSRGSFVSACRKWGVSKIPNGMYRADDVWLLGEVIAQEKAEVIANRRERFGRQRASEMQSKQAGEQNS